MSTNTETAAVPPTAARRRWEIPAWISSFALLLVLLGGWQAYVSLFEISAFILPSPVAVLVSWFDMLQTRSLWIHTWITVAETLAGFFFAVIFGVIVGAILGKWPKLEQILNPFIVTTQVVPKVAIVPLFVLWFGFGMTSKIVVAGLLAFFPILTNTILGVKSVSLGHRDVMITLNASRLQTFLQLELRSALPYILSGMEMGIVLAIIGAVVGEYLGGNQGLGNLAVKEMNSYDTTRLFAVIIHLSVVGFAFYAAMVALRRIFIPWHESVLITRK